MKNRKKPKGTKAEIRAYKKRLQYVAAIVTVAILVTIIAFSSFLIYSYLNPSPNQNTNSTTQLKTAIVDHLSLTVPNQTFIQTATNILETANYTVDYYPGEEVNVEFYRNLPTHGYDLIVLRVHSTFSDESVVLFTSERYSLNKYEYEQLIDRVGAVAYSREESEKGIAYFGILPKFVKYSMKQTFDNTTIIMMGCDGLMYTPMAEAFVKKGAKVYIGWNGPVSASHTDQATTQLLQHLITEKQTIKQAVENTKNEVGPDPADGSILLYYPNTLVDNYIIPNVASNLILNDAAISGYAHVRRHVNCLRRGKNSLALSVYFDTFHHAKSTST
jgi:hypothetical protein